jgi:hypothetical protein
VAQPTHRLRKEDTGWPVTRQALISAILAFFSLQKWAKMANILNRIYIPANIIPVNRQKNSPDGKTVRAHAANRNLTWLTDTGS